MVEKVEYICPIELKKNTVDMIKTCLRKHERGRTIKNMMNDLNLSRGTIKTYLTALVYAKEVEEVIYNQNIKVYFYIKVSTPNRRM